MDALAIVEIPWAPGRYTRQFVLDMLIAAGRPPINSAGRLYEEQKRAWDARQAYLRHLAGGPWAPEAAPADDPDRPWLFRNPHCRFVAIDVPPSWRSAMIRAGFLFPLDYEQWHAEAVANIYAYPIVLALPATAGGGAEPFPTTPTPPKGWDEMATEAEVESAAAKAMRTVLAETMQQVNDRGGSYSLLTLRDSDGRERIYVLSQITGQRARVESPYHFRLLQRVKLTGYGELMLPREIDIVRSYLQIINEDIIQDADVAAAIAYVKANPVDPENPNVDAEW